MALEEVNKLKTMYENVFDSPDGKKVLDDIIKSGGVYRISSNDPIELARDDGKRELALHIRYMSEKRPEPKKENAIT